MLSRQNGLQLVQSEQKKIKKFSSISKNLSMRALANNLTFFSHSRLLSVKIM